MSELKDKLVEQLQNRLSYHPIDVESSPLNHTPVAEAYYEGRAEAYKEILRLIRKEGETHQ